MIGEVEDSTRWMVIRMDDNGAVVLVRDGLAQADAEAMARSLTERAHKQTYEALSYGSAEARRALMWDRGIQA